MYAQDLISASLRGMRVNIPQQEGRAARWGFPSFSTSHASCRCRHKDQYHARCPTREHADERQSPPAAPPDKTIVIAFAGKRSIEQAEQPLTMIIGGRPRLPGPCTDPPSAHIHRPGRQSAQSRLPARESCAFPSAPAARCCCRHHHCHFMRAGDRSDHQTEKAPTDKN